MVHAGRDRDMKEDLTLIEKLREAGATDEMIAQYQVCLSSENRHGQECVLCRLKKMQSERLQKSREKLACLDYIIARIEQTHNMI